MDIKSVFQLAEQKFSRHSRRVIMIQADVAVTKIGLQANKAGNIIVIDGPFYNWVKDKDLSCTCLAETSESMFVKLVTMDGTVITNVPPANTNTVLVFEDLTDFNVLSAFIDGAIFETSCGIQHIKFELVDITYIVAPKIFSTLGRINKIYAIVPMAKQVVLPRIQLAPLRNSLIYSEVIPTNKEI